MADEMVAGFDPVGDALPRAVALLRTLGHEGRLEILCHLIAEERSVTELTQAIGAPQPAISQQLMRLRAEGLVQTRREAQTIYYALAPGPAEAVMHTLHGIYCAPARGGKTRGK